MKFKKTIIGKQDLISGLDSVLHTVVSFGLVNILLVKTSDQDYLSFMNSFALMSLILMPMNLFANNLLAGLAFYDRRYLGSFSLFFKSLLFYSCLSLPIMVVFVEGFFLPGLVAIIIFYLNISVNVLDKEQKYIAKLISTFFGLFLSYLVYLTTENLILSYTFYFAGKAIIYFYNTIQLFRESLKTDKAFVGSIPNNIFFSIASGFGDNGLRFFASILVQPNSFAFFDIILRIFYSGRSLAGRLHYPVLLQLQEKKSEELKRKFLIINIIICLGFFGCLMLLRIGYEKVESIYLTTVFGIILTLVMFVNLMMAYFYNELLKLKKYFFLSLATLVLPIVALVLMYLNVRIEVIIPSSVLAQSLIIFIFYKNFINEAANQKSF